MSLAKLSRRSLLRQGAGVAAVAALAGRPNRARAEETSIRRWAAAMPNTPEVSRKQEFQRWPPA